MDKQHIQDVLIQLNNIYDYQQNLQNQDSNTIILPISPNLLCKIAALELCAWLEDTYDEWIKDYLNQSLSLLPNTEESGYERYPEYLNGWKKAVNKKIEQTQGLSYHGHLRPLLVQLLGELAVLKIENKIGFPRIDYLSQKLDELHKYRIILAHKSIPNIQQLQKFIQPGVINSQYLIELLPILEELEHHLKTMNLEFSNMEIKK